MNNKLKRIINVLLIIQICIFITGCNSAYNVKTNSNQTINQESISLSEIPEYDGEPYVIIQNNEPEFERDELTTKSYESYSDLDELGRCGMAEASIGIDIMPTEKRGAIGDVKPTGWHIVKYDCVDGKYLYNRCHLLGYQLTGENANEKNLITGSRYLNVEGMLPFEDMVADYVKETENHVMYKVTPVFEGDNLVASGVEMQAYSVEDDGEGISFHVYCYNVQPEIEIDYATGESSLDGTVADSGVNKEQTIKNSSDKNNATEYVLNRNKHRFHLSSCFSVKQIRDENKETYIGSRKDLIEQGYEPCKNCKP